ncbi:MAG: hypothetical protein JWM02_768 [Frankiales bacterium]|nr:hypothetical protein [Frankiales bacterium]
MQSVVELGHNLGLTIVAEGVENAHTLTVLEGFGCDVAQGYQLSRPMTSRAFDAWYTECTPGSKGQPTQDPPSASLVDRHNPTSASRLQRLGEQRRHGAEGLAAVADGVLVLRRQLS